ncbi:MAG: hypothetical protein R3C49_06715 [Planctomycetaceae bacterium]
MNDLVEVVVVDTVSDVSDGDTRIEALLANKVPTTSSLREAIAAANNQVGLDVIEFNIAGGGTR